MSKSFNSQPGAMLSNADFDQIPHDKIEFFLQHVHLLKTGVTHDCCSILTNRGIPLELAFVWPNYQVRCTVDVDMCATGQQRFSKSLQAVESCIPGIIHPVVQLVKDGLQHNRFRYGAWLGYRQERACPKLYAELIPAIWQQHVYQQIVQNPGKIIQRGIQPVMFGWQPDNGSYEVYYKSAFLRPIDIDELYRFFELPEKGGEIKRLCERLLQKKIAASFPFPDIGFSVSFDADGHAEVFTLYAFAQSMLGMDHQIRTAILSLGRGEQWDMDAYESLTHAFSIKEDYSINTYHGMVGFASGRSGGIGFTVGISPCIKN